jgi:hypothetical protein
MKKKTYNPFKKVLNQIEYSWNIQEVIDGLFEEVGKKEDGKMSYKEAKEYFRNNLIWKYMILKDGEIIKEQTADCSKLQFRIKGKSVYLGNKGSRELKYFKVWRDNKL